MANLNLSEFGEKLFVADADHTFIWDTAASISKRVSRNSWLNSGTLTADAPVTISQTWNNAAVAFTGLKVVATDTASLSASNLLELWSGSTPALNFRVSKSGAAHFGSGSGRPILFDANGGIGINRADVSLTAASIYLGNNGSAPRITIVSGGTIGWSASTADVSGGNATPDTVLLRDGAPNTLALRNGAAAQTFNVYGTYTSASVYERLAIRYNGTDLAFQISTQQLGATARPLQLQTDSVTRMHISTAGNVGIGTTAPTAPLDVVGGIRFNSIAIARSASIGTLPNSTTGLYFGYDGTGDRSFFTSGTTNVSGVVSVRKPAIFDYSTFTFTRDGINADVFLNSSGNVGIGTTSPTSKLHVNGAIIQKPDASATPAANGDLVVESTSNTTLTFKLKGTDGTVRSGTITLA